MEKPTLTVGGTTQKTGWPGLFVLCDVSLPSDSALEPASCEVKPLRTVSSTKPSFLKFWVSDISDSAKKSNEDIQIDYINYIFCVIDQRYVCCGLGMFPKDSHAESLVSHATVFRGSGTFERQGLLGGNLVMKVLPLEEVNVAPKGCR